MENEVLEVFETLVSFQHKTPYGNVLGLQVVSDEELDILSEAKEKVATVFLGEVIGKHSAVATALDYENCLVLTDDVEEIELFRDWFPTGVFGFDIVSAVKKALSYD